MHEINVCSWESFELRIAEMRQQHLSAAHDINSSPLLFRGQGDASWSLTTTLERAGHENMSFTAYYQVINRLSSEIETFTGMNWEIPPFPTMDRLLRQYEGMILPLDACVYKYMLYLRHHGFPSPLLDWTRSPYVAAYFAFRKQPNDIDGKVSIYVFSETPEGFKAAGNDRARIVRFGPYVRSHRRHFLQQSDYSICVVFDKLWRFVTHQNVFGLEDPHQDVLTKINIPSAERLKVLRTLDDHNLNAFSLFGSEESLMATLALRGLEYQKSTAAHSD